MTKTFTLILALAAAALIIGSQALYIVDQREQAVLLQLGQPVGEVKGPGLHMKIPLIQNVQRFDSRILSIDPTPEEVVISSSSIPGRTDEENKKSQDEQAADTAEESAPINKPVIANVTGEPIFVDTFARYRITNPIRFLEALRTIEGANIRLESILNDATRAELGKTSLQDLLSPKRTQVMQNIQRNVNASVKKDNFGIEIIDVRIVRADLTADLRTSTVRRMISELKERATETRAKGEERALEISSTAEKERTVLIAEAERDAQKIRGEGDNEAIKIYAQAFNKDKDFYSFIRSMEAYSNTLADPDTRLILSPDSEFFKHFSNQ